MTATKAKSPCINICRMNPVSHWCEGCLRTIDEIAAWSRLDDAGRQAVLARLPTRAARVAHAQLSPGAEEDGP